MMVQKHAQTPYPENVRGKERLWQEVGVLGPDGRVATVDNVAAVKQ